MIKQYRRDPLISVSGTLPPSYKTDTFPTISDPQVPRLKPLDSETLLR